MEGEELLPAEERERSVLIKYPTNPESAIFYGIAATRNQIQNVIVSIEQVGANTWKISLEKGEMGDLLNALRMLNRVEILQSDL
jgi:hypothetical protein